MQPGLGHHRRRRTPFGSPQRRWPCNSKLAGDPPSRGWRHGATDHRWCIAAAAGVSFESCSAGIDAAEAALIARACASSIDEERLARSPRGFACSVPVYVSDLCSISIHLRCEAGAARVECNRDCHAVSLRIHVRALCRVPAGSDGSFNGRAGQRVRWRRDRARRIVGGLIECGPEFHDECGAAPV